MGKANRERRRIKEKARKRARSSRGPGPEGFPGDSFFTGDFVGDDVVDGFLHGGPATTPTHEESARSLIDQALTSLCQRQDQVASRLMSRLAGTTDVRWRQAVDRTLHDQLLRTIKHLWQHGWQPADLLRVAARTTDAAQQRLLKAGMAAELAGYAPITIDPRWAAQLAEGTVEVWWEPQLNAVQACALTYGDDRPGFVHATLELLHALAHLPPLERLGPLPGTAVPEPKTPRHAVDERILGRVRAFLAKAESTPYPAEAETFTAAAQALMARHAIDHALLAATGRAPSDEPTARRIGVDNPYEAPKVTLLHAIADANRCRTAWNKAFGFVTVVGYPTDLDTIELLFTSLLVQATTAMTREGSRTTAGGRSRTRSFRQSFLLSYAARIRERLTETTREQTDAAVAEPGGGRLLPVLAARQDAVEDVTNRMFPHLKLTSVSRAADLEGWSSGRAAADLAVLNHAPAVDC